MSNKVAVVTGGNKGIGYAIVKGLAKEFEGTVYLTARNIERGNEAVQKLKKEDDISVKFHQLDIDDESSIQTLASFMKENHGGIDILVNNAGIAFKKDATESVGHQAEITIKTNYFSLKNTCQILFPIMKEGGRVVNLSSSCGHLSKLTGGEAGKATELKTRFASSGSTLTLQELDNLMNSFVSLAKAGTHMENGWPSSTYVVSKIGVSALSRIQQQNFDKAGSNDIVVNHVHPGWVDTDMTSHKGPLSPDTGAKSALFAALLPPGTHIKGEYIWEDCKPSSWVDGYRG